VVRIILLVLLAGAAGTGFYFRETIRDYVCTSSYLAITRITFTGLAGVREAELRDLLGPVGGTNLMALDAVAAQARLESHPWVARARLHRHLPGRLRVEITERRPVALLSHGSLWALDASAVALPVDPQRGMLDLPLVHLDLERNPEPGLALPGERLTSLLPGLEALRRRLPHLWSAISEVSWDSLGQLEMVALNHPARVLVGKEATWKQMRNLYTFIVYQGRRSGTEDVEFVDLRFPGQVVVRRAPAQEDSTGRPEAALRSL